MLANCFQFAHLADPRGVSPGECKSHLTLFFISVFFLSIHSWELSICKILHCTCSPPIVTNCVCLLCGAEQEVHIYEIIFFSLETAANWCYLWKQCWTDASVNKNSEVVIRKTKTKSWKALKLKKNDQLNGGYQSINQLTNHFSCWKRNKCK